MINLTVCCTLLFRKLFLTHGGRLLCMCMEKYFKLFMTEEFLNFFFEHGIKLITALQVQQQRNIFTGFFEDNSFCTA